MIQTQLLRLDPPYQIVSAGGQVGIQVATLIVTDDRLNEFGDYSIDTHSHPVVSYGLKQGLENELNYGGSHPDEEYERYQRLQPEGAVWNRVEINDIRVLGLAGARNSPVTIDSFIYLIPSSFVHLPYRNVWSEKTIAKMYNLIYGFNRVGLRCEKKKWKPSDIFGNRDDVMYIEINVSSSNIPLVHVVIKDEDVYDPMSVEVGFRLRLYENGSDNIDGCVRNIVYAFRALESNFIDGRISDKFICRQGEQGQALEDVLEQLTKRVNKELGLSQ